jgi:hypothetical protein
MEVKEKIIRWFKELLEKNNGKEVEFDIMDLVEYLKSERAPGWVIGDLWLILEDLRRVGRLLYYYDENRKTNVLVKVVD